jgi:hypothetical protein
MPTLETGVNVIVNQRVGGVNTPIYPFTKTANVQDAKGNNLDTIIDGLAPKNHGNHVPDYASETVSSLKFLRNDNTWAEIQAASTSVAGVVQLSDSTSTDSSTTAATSKAVKAVKDAVDSLNTDLGNDYVAKSSLGVASGVATLDTNGLVPSSQLPSYVDDVVDIQYVDSTTAKDSSGTTITPETGKIYVDDIGDGASEKTYRWSGSQYVVISETLALGETSSTAFDGARGKVAYDHSQATHARTDATLTEASTQNGYIKINGSETLVYTHPGTGTNPHGTTAADVGLGNVENKNVASILDELTDTIITTKLGYTPQNAATAATESSSGVMTGAMVKKLNNCLQTEVVAAGSTPTITDGIVFQIVAD